MGIPSRDLKRLETVLKEVICGQKQLTDRGWVHALPFFLNSNLGMKYRRLFMKFADGMKEESIINAEEKLYNAQEEMDNVVDKGKDG